MIDYPNILNEIYTNLNNQTNKGKVASYIPELSKMDINNFGIHLNLVNGQAILLVILKLLFQYKVFLRSLLY